MNSLVDYTKPYLNSHFLLGTTNATICIFNVADSLTASGDEFIDLSPDLSIEKLWEDRVELANIMKLSESALRKEWDSPEEDEAWAHL
ncbi:MAG TPA: hypothetical protein VLH59_14925 [Ignavibacteriaceae bacterium]|jgi:hypothetical protein|nr:hypothetical protein [Ignavibacteriaceae bacterium]